ncbi:hypothetical protein QSJ18_19165 [Gordonia sp. ABSL1-1]|uniref:hypothetical protein n=1 Tax=Gordonia sp. ABSL1-1 TaxID=3053923 RepID=UPI002573DC7C|nr:hypothetical protein [Gordonia sp. ABSL1-1]MDL9938872.1 hypothetical protein [Gordonia sp. ABSL1-1]
MTDDPVTWLREVQQIIAAGTWVWAQDSTDLGAYITSPHGLGLAPAGFHARLDAAEAALSGAADDLGTVELTAFAGWLRTAVARPEGT